MSLIEKLLSKRNATNLQFDVPIFSIANCAAADCTWNCYDCGECHCAVCSPL